jgi:glycosyltransferase involved in cell wall biosynthesis
MRKRVDLDSFEMKILLITSHLKVGGIPVYTVTLANHLSKRGHKVFVASSGGVLKSELSSGVVHIDVPLDTKSVISPKVWMTALKLRSFIKREGMDIIHAQTRVAHFTAHILSRMTGAPYIVTWHGFYRPHFFRKFLPCWGDRTIAISEAVARNLREAFGRDNAKIRVVLNGIDLDKFRAEDYGAKAGEIRVKYGLKDAPIVGIVSRLSSEKGHMVLLEAFGKLLDNVPDAQLIIVGDGRMRDELEEKARQIGIERSVFFFGQVLNVAEFLAITDVFVRPSIIEGFGLGVVEAMMMRCPVVASDLSEFRQILDDGKAGLLVRTGDADSLKEALLKLLRDPASARSLGRAGYERALKNFSAERLASDTENIYKEAIRERT